MHLHYKDQPINVVCGCNWCRLCKSCETYIRYVGIKERWGMSRPLLHVVTVVVYSAEKDKFTEIRRICEVIMS